MTRDPQPMPAATLRRLMEAPDESGTVEEAESDERRSLKAAEPTTVDDYRRRLAADFRRVFRDRMGG